MVYKSGAEDLYLATSVVGTLTKLAGRLNTGLTGVTSAEGEKKRLTGFLAKTANTGFFVVSVGNRVVLTIDGLIAAAQEGPIPLDVDVEPGETATVAYQSSSGTAYAAACLLYERQ